MTVSQELNNLNNISKEQLAHSGTLQNIILLAKQTMDDFHSCSAIAPQKLSDHVFVVSSNVSGCFELLTDMGSIKVHVIYPAITFQDAEEVRCSPNFSSVPVKSLDSSANWRDPSRFLLDRLQTMLGIARADNGSGSITDLALRIKSAGSCKIVNVFGKQDAAELLPGQVITLLVKVKVPAVSRPRTTKFSMNLRKTPTQRYNDALMDLEGMLGETITDVMSVEVRYKHSAFPKNTEMVIMETVRISRPDPTSVWSTAGDADSRRAKDHEIESLTYYVASHFEPGAALQILKEMFGSGSAQAPFPGYLHRVLEELHHRSGKRGDTTNSEANPGENAGDSPQLGRFSFEHRFCVVDGQRSPVLKRSASDSPATVIHRRTPDDRYLSAETSDQARKIWHIMRRDSRSKHAAQNDSTESLDRLESTDDQLREIRRRALQNKRSVGADTLKSFAKGGLEGGAAPWL